MVYARHYNIEEKTGAATRPFYQSKSRKPRDEIWDPFLKTYCIFFGPVPTSQPIYPSTPSEKVHSDNRGFTTNAGHSREAKPRGRT